MTNKISFLIATVTLAMNCAFAAAPLEKACGAAACPSDTDYAGQVKALFDAGTAPGKLNPGDYTGRCYGVPAGNPPTTYAAVSGQGAFLAIVNLSENANQGPLFPGTSEIGFAVVSPANAELTHYDDGRNLDDLGDPNSNVLPACVQNGDVIAMSETSQQDPSTYGSEGYILRKNGDRLVVKAEWTADVAGQVKAGDAFGYCYFFKKVK